MPRQRWRRRGRRTPLSAALALYLQTGDWSRALDQVKDGESPNALELYSLAGAVLRGAYAQLQAIWGEHRAEILGAWTRAHPGSRPFAWWVHEAPETRRCVADRGDHLDRHLRPEQAEVIWRREFGIPAFAQVGHFTISFESEAAYLDRHALLAAEERARLPREAFELARIEVDAPSLEELTAGRRKSHDGHL